MIRFILLSVAVYSAAATVWSAEPVVSSHTLSQVYALALQRAETVGISEAEVARAEARYVQLRGAVLPLVGFEMTHRRQDTSGARTGTAFPLQDRLTESRFYLNQPIFSGFREFAGLKAQGSIRQASEEAARWARLQLYNDVAATFYLALEAQQRVANLNALVDASSERVGELSRRVNIGRSRQAENLSTRSQQASLQARREEAAGQAAVALDLLRSLTAVPITALADDRPSPVAPPALETLLARIPERPDVRQAEAEARAADHLLSAARRDVWPTLDLDANYYTKRPISQQNIDWDLLFTLDVPIYRGGTWRAGVEVAKAERRQAQLRRDLARRLASEDIRTVWLDLATGIRRLKHLSEAAELAEANYRTQRKEYGLGLVTNLEVITALDDWENARGDFDAVRLGVKLLMVRLAAATADVPEAR